jgi:hypothetical protein
LEGLHIPTVTLVTEQFSRLALATARGKRMPGLPIAALPHGYDQLPEAAIRSDVGARLPTILAALLQAEQPVVVAPPEA